MTRRLGELLVAEGRISQEVLDRALQLQQTQAQGIRLGAILLRWGLIPEHALLEALSMHHRCAALDWTTLSAATQEAVDLLSPAQSSRLGAVPYAVDRKTVRVVFANPSNLAAIDEVQAITGKRVIPSVTTEVRLRQAQQRFYKQPLAREVWAILQKIERPAPPAILSPSAPGLSASEPRSLWIENEARPEEISAASPQAPEPVAVESPELEDDDVAIEDLVEPAPALGVSIAAGDSSASAQELPDHAEQAISIFISKGTDSDGLTSLLDGLPLPEPLTDRLDPFSDDTPLTEFIEQALSFYETHPTFRSALAALDDGSIEDLGREIEEPRPPSGRILDSTHPSPRRRHPESATN